VSGIEVESGGVGSSRCGRRHGGEKRREGEFSES